MAGKATQYHGTAFHPAPVWARFGGEGIPAAVLLAEGVDERPQVDELVLEQERIGVAEEDEVVAGLALGLGGPLGRELEALDGVDLDGDPRLLAEELGLPAQFIVRGRDEMIVAERLSSRFCAYAGARPSSTVAPTADVVARKVRRVILRMAFSSPMRSFGGIAGRGVGCGVGLLPTEISRRVSPPALRCQHRYLARERGRLRRLRNWYADRPIRKCQQASACPALN